MLIATLLFSIHTNPLYSQETYQLKDMFMDAESWFYFQDYKNSLPLYLQILDAYPENHSFNYKVGICYLNIEGEKHKAIPYLEKAIENTTFNYSEEAFYEKKAPVDAIFYLANAYFIDNQIDKALETYEKFEDKIEGKRWLFRNIDFDNAYLQKQKEKCKTAKELMSKPVNYMAENIGAPVNTPQSEYNPVISGDEKTMVFTADKKFYTGVFMSKKKNGEWGPPQNLLPQLGIDGDIETTSLSHDGTEMYLYREDDLTGNIYVSHYEDGRWSKIKKLGENINTKYWESHAFITQDGNELYFTSNREGGVGDLDIYKAKKNEDGTWGKPENLGETINTEWKEDTPFLTNNGKTLFFSSEGHNNMGGFDLFVAHKTEDGWTQPKNLGYPINSTDDDRFMNPVNKGKNAYYAHFNKKAEGGKDIFKYYLKDIPDTDFIDVEGVITYESEDKKQKKDFTINLVNTKTNDTIIKLNPEDPEQNFTYETPDGKPHLIYQTPLLEDNKQYIVSKDFEIKEKFPTPVLAKEDTEEIQTKPAINLDKDVFRADAKDDNIKIKLKLQGGNKLVVDTYQEGKLVNTEDFTLESEDFIYEYTPDEKETKLTFQLFDNEQNILSKDVSIFPDTTKKEKPQEEYEKLTIQEKSVSFDDGKKKIKIRLSLEKDSKLYVETFMEDSLINKETFNITQEEFTYEFEPKEGKSRVNFKMIDKLGAIKNQEVVISHIPVNTDLEKLLNTIDTHDLEKLSSIIERESLSELSLQQLLDSLFSHSDSLNIAQDTDIFLITATRLKAGDPEKFYKDLINLGDKSIQEFLSQYNWEKLESNENILGLLNWGVQENKIKQQSYRELLRNYLSEYYTTEELKELITLLSDFDLNNILSKLGVEALDIVTTDDLIRIIQKKDINNNEEIIAFLESQVLLNKAYESKDFEIAKISKPEPTKKGRQVYKYVISILAGLVILFLIILWVRRKKQNSKNG
ncbi:MAG: hypothetical protein ACOCQ8_01155 [Bacteroidia bacterium]